MSNRYRNPFKIRATEKLESENNFLRTYSPYILDELVDKNQGGKLWNNILFIRSSPGAGKTSILKIFEPLSLTTLASSLSATYYKDILDYLKKLEIIDNNGSISILGAYLSCARNYEVIDDLDISEGQKRNVFFALINARIVLSVLKSLMQLYKVDDIDDIRLEASAFDYSYLNLKFPVSGTELFNWAADIEKSVFSALDSFLPVETVLQGYSELFAFDLMQPSNILVKDKNISERILFMFDDTHKLGKSQRESFLKYITEKRADYNIWIAERLEALDEQRNFGSFRDRDYNEINLEEIWQGPNNKLKKILLNIAEKRASMSSEDVKSFADFLEQHINESEFEDKFLSAFEVTFNNLSKITGFTSKFNSWIDYLQTKKIELPPYQLARLSKQIEILVHRNLGRTQLSFEFPLTVSELEDKLGGELQSTANFFLYINHKIPYYFGFEDVARLSSNNIEQFLSFAAELFEFMLAQKISGKAPNIDAAGQEKVLKKVAEMKWQEQLRLIPYSELVLKFLGNIAKFFQKETNKPNAPYAPGVNGFAIKDPKEQKLIEEKPWKEDVVYTPLMNVLKTCLAYNLLEKRITKQGKENELWTVYYLNRWVCLRFNLPLNYGGFRHKEPSELLKWTK